MSPITFRCFGRREFRAAVLLLAGLAVLAGLLLVVPAGAAGDPATLTIVKQTDPDGGEGFPFTLSSNGPALVWGSLGSSPGQFLLPTSAAVDTSGNVYVTDAFRVQKFDANGAYLTQWGVDGSGDGQFHEPDGIAVDNAGNVYVADTFNHRVQVFSSSGTFLRKWGSNGTSDGQFQRPFGIAVDSAGRVFVADTGNNRIQVFDSNGVFQRKWGSSGSGIGQFNTPRGIAADSTGNVYVADTVNHRVQKFTNLGVFVSSWGTNGTGDGQFREPAGIAVDGAGQVYVTELAGQRVQKFGSSGVFLKKWQSAGLFNYPYGIAVDSNSDALYVADTFNYRIQKFVDTAATLEDGELWTHTLHPASYSVTELVPPGWSLDNISCSGGNPQVRGYTVVVTVNAGDDVTCTFTNQQPATLSLLKATLPSGASDFPFTLVSGNPSLIWGGNGSAPGQLIGPAGIAASSTGDIFVADRSNHRIQKFDSHGAIVTMWGSQGSGAGQFNYVNWLAVDAAGFVYSTDNNNYIQKFTGDGVFQGRWGGSGSGNGLFNQPAGIAVSGNHVFVVDRVNNRIQKFTTSGSYVTQWGSAGAGNGQFNLPQGLAVDTEGYVYVADTANNRVQKFDSNGVFVTKWGSLGTGDGNFNQPTGIAVDETGNVYVGERENHRVQKFDRSGIFLAKWGSVGIGPGQFNHVSGVALRNGAVFVVDQDNHRIQKFVDAATTLNDGESVVYDLDAATYTVSEWMPEGWSLADITCDGGNPQVVINTVTLTLLPGDDIACTFTNVEESSITIIKEVIGRVPTEDWQFSGDLGDFTFPPEGFQTDFYPLAPGHYTITETAVPGYAQQVSCNTGEAGTDSVTIDLQAGEDVTCTFVNTAEATLTLVKEADSSGGIDFPFAIVGSLNIWGGFENPRGLGVDSSGNVYVSDYQSWIRKYDITGTQLLAQWGGYGVGNGQLRHPTGLTLDVQDFVYVADTANQRVVKYTADGTYVTQWGSAGNGDGQFLHVRDIAVSSSGNVYVIDRDRHDIQVFDTNGVYHGRWGTRGNGSGQFESPESVAVDSSGRVYVADTGNSRIQVFDADGVYQGEWGHATGLNHPSALEVDESGNIYVADTWNDLVQKFDSSGNFIAAWTVARSIYNPSPAAIAVNDRGQVYVGDTSNSRIQMFFDTQPTLGDGESVMYAISPGSYEVRELLPNGWVASNIACDGGNPQVVGSRVRVTVADGDAVVCTYTDAALSVATASLAIAKQTDPAGGRGYQFGVLSSLNRWGPIENPRGVAIDSFGNVYLTDYAGTIFKYDRTGTHLLLTFGGYGNAAGKFSHARGLDIDADDLVYVTDLYNHRVQKLDSQGNFLGQWGSQGTGAGQFLYPRDIAVAGDGRVYVVDMGNHRIQVFDTNGVYIDQWGNHGSGDGQFESPEGIAVDNDGHVYVADTGNNRVQAFDAQGKFVGQFGSLTGIGHPNGVDVDAAGNIYVTDTDNDRIQVFDRNSTYLTSWIVPRATYSSAPAAIAISERGDVYVADMPNGRIHRFYHGQLTLDDDGLHSLSVPPGRYDVSEVMPAGWELRSIVCTGGSPQLGTDRVSVFLAPDDDVTCTFTNYSPNQPPVANGDVYATDEDTPLVISALGVLENDTDPDQDPLTAVLVADVSHGTLGLNTDGSFSYTPHENYNGADSFTYRANDGAEDSEIATVSITVNSVNDPPVASDLSVTTDEDVPVSLSLSGSDIEGDGLSYRIVSGPAHGALSGTMPGLTFTPEANYNGPDSFSYKASDGTADSNIATVSITVNPVNDPPVVIWSTPPTSPATLGVTTVAAEVAFSDVDSSDLHTCAWDWGDGTSDGPTPCTPGTLAGSHVYAVIGSHTVTMTVTDSEAVARSVTATVAVMWPFDGFFPPVNNLPVVNSVKGGSGVPVKFGLGGDFGLGIIAEGYPKSVRIACDSGSPTDDVEETVTAGNSSLQYNALTGQYTYVWKTSKLWTGTCRQFRLMLIDGTTHEANFRFR